MVDVAALQFVGPSTLVYNLFLNILFSHTTTYYVFPLLTHTQHSIIYTHWFQWWLGNPLIWGSLTLTPSKPQRLLAKLLFLIYIFFTTTRTRQTTIWACNNIFFCWEGMRTRQKGQHIDWPFQGLIDWGKRIDPFTSFVCQTSDNYNNSYCAFI